MCGRFTRAKTVKEVARLFELAEPPPERAAGVSPYRFFTNRSACLYSSTSR